MKNKETTTQTPDAKDAISEKINGQQGQQKQASEQPKDEEVKPMPDLTKSLVQQIKADAKNFMDGLGISEERAGVIAGHAADALMRYDDRKRKGKSLLVSDACLLCENANEVAYICYMIGSFLEQSPMLGELAAMAMLGGRPGRSKGGIIIQL